MTGPDPAATLPLWDCSGQGGRRRRDSPSNAAVGLRARWPALRPLPADTSRRGRSGGRLSGGPRHRPRLPLVSRARVTPVSGEANNAPDAQGKISVVLADDHELVRDGIRHGARGRAGHRGRRPGGRRRDRGPLRARPQADDPRARPEHAGQAESRADPRGPRVLPRDRGDRPDDAERAGRSRARRCRPGRKGFVVKQSAGEPSSCPRCARSLAGETYINPKLGARLAASPPAAEGRRMT